jgi:RimJ/RimL family protein N-acetyltransferase
MPILIPPVVAAGTMADRAQPEIAVDPDLRLRPWRPSDAPAVIEAFSDPDIQRWHFRRYETVTEAEEWIDAEIRGWRAETGASWAVTRAGSGEVAGRVAVYPVLQDGYAEVTYWVLPPVRGEGIATRATIAATRWAHELGIHRIQLQYSTRNEPSAGVARKAGFQIEGVRREANLHDDGWHDMCVCSRLSTD